MTKAAATSTTKHTKQGAKRAFFVGLFDLSWRLLGAMLAPLFIGLYIDSRQAGDGQGFALGGFLLGMVAGVLVMRGVVRKLAGKTS